MLISWNVTKKCNLSCQHCYRDSDPDVSIDKELVTEEGKTLLNQIKTAGFKLIIFSGGEPLVRKDIFELILYAKEIGLIPVLGTNGILLTEDMCKKLKNSGLSGLAVSLDSTDSYYHDKFRNLSGAWKKSVQGIKNSIDSGIRVQINMTLTKNNIKDFEKMADFAEEIEAHALHPFFLVPTGRGKDIEEDSIKSSSYFNMIKTVLDKQKKVTIELKPTCAPQFMPMAKDLEIPMRYSRGCLAGISYCCILPNGEVHICPYLAVSIGNVRETSFDKLWKESKIFNELRDYSKYEGRCGACNSVDICGGCRARAYYYSNGNYMAEEPWCYKNME